MTREEAIDNLQDLWNEVYNEDSDGYNYAVAIDMAINALAVYPHYKWERDIALSQLEEYGIGFAEKKRDDLVEVVRCKDCRHQNHCYQTVSHNKTHDGFKEYWAEPVEWCSRGERREP